MYQQVVRN